MTGPLSLNPVEIYSDKESRMDSHIKIDKAVRFFQGSGADPGAEEGFHILSGGKADEYDDFRLYGKQWKCGSGIRG